MENKNTDLEVLERLIIEYKNESEQRKKRVLYINLVQESLKLVKKIVSRIYPLPRIVNSEDLIQVGALGVLTAIESYQVSEKGHFKTYATKFIRGKILHYLRDKANIVKPPRDSIEHLTKIRNAIDYLAVKHSKAPNAEEVAEYLGLPVEKVEEVINMDMLKNIVSLDQNIFTDEGNETLLDRLQVEDSHEEMYENKKIIEYAINKLPNTDKLAITMYYIEGESRKNISEKLKVSPTQVSRIIKRALNKLYNIMQKELEENNISIY